MEPRYPPAERQDVVDVLHGRRVEDPYRWLEDPTDERTRRWSAAQDELAATELGRLPGRERLAARLTELLAAGTVEPPEWRADRPFFLRRDPGQEHARLLTVDADGTERALVDPQALDPTGATTLDAWEPDPTGGRVAYQLSTGGDEESTLRVLDVASGEVVEGPVDRVRYSPVAWLPDGSFYYVRRQPPGAVPAGEEAFHRRVRRHRPGRDFESDAEVFGAGLATTNYYDVRVSHDGRHLVVSASAGTAPRTDVWLADLAEGDPDSPIFVDVVVGADARTWLHPGRRGRWYAVTDHGAPRGRVAVLAGARPQPEHWQELIPEDPEAVLTDIAVLDGPPGDGSAAGSSAGGRAADSAEGRLLVCRSRHGVGELTLHALSDGRRLADLPLPGLGSAGPLTERPEGGTEAWFGYTDPLTPPQVHRVDARDGGVRLWQRAPGSPPASPVRAVQHSYASADGTEVRLDLLTPSDAAPGPRPMLLYGYGGFAVSLTPAYSATALAWVEAGGSYAIAHLRGGGEEGEGWHRAGMREHKQRVFDDFLAAARYLVAIGLTTPDRLAVAGGSNGGLLVGAALTQEPTAMAAVACSAPLLDMVRYERFGLGATWSDEFGSAEHPAELDWLLGYSPYHHVVVGRDYPAVLFTVFDADTRVDPLHARKMCAALQHATVGHRPVLLRREADVGHGARSVTRTSALAADTLAFLARWTGLAL